MLSVASDTSYHIIMLESYYSEATAESEKPCCTAQGNTMKSF